MEVQQIKQVLDEREGQIIEEVSEVARDIIRRELALVEFELALSAIPQENREITEKAVQELRTQKWNSALEKAEGDEELALSIYEETSL